MNIEEALDKQTVVDVKTAITELKKHSFDGFVGGNKLMVVASNPGDFAEIVCDVKDGMVKSHKVLEWLGY